jgi:hypothetical protein
LPQESVYHLVERANENGGPDNITAIVMRVVEVGWEPPNTRHPVRVGAGREVGDDDTAILGKLSGSLPGSSLRSDDFRSSGSTLRVPTGALVSPDSITAPQPAFKTTRPKRSRLFYPTLILFVLLVAALVAGASYLFVRSRDEVANVDTSLRSADSLIDQAKADITHDQPDPVMALNRLTRARTNLLSLQNASLSETQHTQFVDLQKSFTSTVKNTITTYNHKYNIVSLPCGGTSLNGLSSGSTTAQPKSLATIEDTTGKNLLSYALGDDKNLYQLTPQHALGNKVRLENTDMVRVEAVSSAGSHILALLSLPAAGNTLTYKLSLLLPRQDGGLQEAQAVTVDTPADYTPRFMTASTTDAYLVLMPQAASTSPQIVSYTLKGTGTDTRFNTPPAKATISISKNIVSLAVLNVAQKTQLIFLFSDGSIQSLQLVNGSSASPSPVNVQTHTPITAPLPVSATNFTLSLQTPVPTPVPQLTVPSLSVPGATLLAAGSVGNDTGHLFVVAPAVNGTGARILDLKVMQGTPNVSPTPTPTPAPASATPGTAGGGVAQYTLMYMDVAQQYAPDSSIPDVKSMVVDPKGNGFYLLTQNAQNNTAPLLVSQNVCAP